MKGVAIVVLLVGACAFGKIAPSFQAQTVDGKRIQLKEMLKPDRGLLLSFWATWCAPCLEELGHVTDALKKDPAMKLDVLAVNVDTSETASDVKPTIKLYKFEVPIALDPKHEIFSKYQSAKTLPFSVLLSPTGEILETFNGYNEGMIPMIQKKLSALGKGTNATP